MKPNYLVLIVLAVLISACVPTKRVSFGGRTEKIVHKSLQKCDSNTVDYVLYNYIDHKDQFIGKPASLIFNSLEYRVSRFAPSSDSINPDMEKSSQEGLILVRKCRNNISFDIKAITLLKGVWSGHLNSDGKTSRKTLRVTSSPRLIVIFQKPIPNDSIIALYPVRDDFGRWRPEVAEAFGKLVVKDVKCQYTIEIP